MKKTGKKIALALSAILFLQPLMFAVDSKLNEDIASLEIEITKMKTKTGEYADMTEAALNKKIEKAEKELKSKKEKAKEEAKKDAERLKESTKKAGKDIKKAGEKAGKEFKKAGKEIGNAFKDIIGDD